MSIEAVRGEVLFPQAAAGMLQVNEIGWREAAVEIQQLLGGVGQLVLFNPGEISPVVNLARARAAGSLYR